MKMQYILGVPARPSAVTLRGTVLLVVSILGSPAGLVPASTSGVPRALDCVWSAGRAEGLKGAQLQAGDHVRRGQSGLVDHGDVHFLGHQRPPTHHPTRTAPPPAVKALAPSARRRLRG